MIMMKMKINRDRDKNDNYYVILSDNKDVFILLEMEF